MNFLLEIILFLCIIYLLYKNFQDKKYKINADSLIAENNNLKNQITQLHHSFRSEQQSILQQKNDLILKEKDILSKNAKLEQLLSDEIDNRKKIVNQKKSSEVRLGHIAETLAPFLDQFDFEPEQCSFLGQPIDYISFGDKEITLIEVKSGKSQLNSKQRKIRDQVKNKQINWKEIRIQ